MLNLSQVTVNVAYRWIYGIFLYAFILYNYDKLAIGSLSQSQVFLGATIFFAQYILLNVLFSSWVAMKKFSNFITVLGLIMDIVFISGINYVLGHDSLGLIVFFIIPLIFSAPSRILQNLTYFCSVVAIVLVSFLRNGSAYFFTKEITFSTLFSVLTFTLFFLLVKYLVYNNTMENVKKNNLVFHEIRNYLTVILGYINILNVENVTEGQKKFFYNAIENSTIRIRNLCNKPSLAHEQPVDTNQTATGGSSVNFKDASNKDSNYVKAG